MINALKKVNDWQSLGLQLGLLYPTPEKIVTDNHGKVEQCKTKMIAMHQLHLARSEQPCMEL